MWRKSSILVLANNLISQKEIKEPVRKFREIYKYHKTSMLKQQLEKKRMFVHTPCMQLELEHSVTVSVGLLSL